MIKKKNKYEKNKLRTYRMVKSNTKYETYLDTNLPKNKIAEYTKFRLSAHTLNIEKARHIKYKDKNNTELNNKQKFEARKCKLCYNNEDEDEIHFLLNCKKHKLYRDEYLTKIFSTNKNIQILSQQQLFIWILSNEDKYINTLTINYVFDINTNRCINDQ